MLDSYEIDFLYTMLKVDDLESQLKTAFSNTIPPAIKQIILAELPTKTATGDELAERVANIFDDLVSAQLAKLVAYAIDYYVKNAAITGTIITTGSPTMQTAKIFSSPTPTINGKIPNTLGIK